MMPGVRLLSARLPLVGEGARVSPAQRSARRLTSATRPPPKKKQSTEQAVRDRGPRNVLLEHMLRDSVDAPIEHGRDLLYTTAIIV